MIHAPNTTQAVVLVVGALLLVVGVDCACRKSSVHTGPPVPPVIVERRCELPPKPVLPTPKAHRPGDGSLTCFTPEEANKLRERDAKLKQWIREVLARCASDAEEAKDAGSTSTED